MLRCAVLDDYQRVARGFGDWESLAGRVDVRFLHERLASVEAVASAIGDCEIVVAMRERTPFQRSLLERLPKLKLLVTTGMRNAAIDLKATRDLGIAVCGTRVFDPGTVEHTWALILAFARHIPRESASLRTGGPWQSTVGMDVHGKTLGVLGLGRLGSQVAAIGRAFGMRVTAWSQNLTHAACAAAGVEHAGTLDDLIAGADILTIHLVLSKRTRGLIGDAQLRRMKRTALLVNTSRGPIVDEAALLSTLREGRIRGAALDVFDVEPLPLDHPLRGLDNVLATPHLGYVSEESYRLLYGDVVADIGAWLDGKLLREIAL
jgi:phosphoglycerate dehydrogenase-like enzyme